MSQTRVTWECDRCGKKVAESFEGIGHAPPPDDWAEFKCEKVTWGSHLCRRCVGELVDWWELRAGRP